MDEDTFRLSGPPLLPHTFHQHQPGRENTGLVVCTLFFLSVCYELSYLWVWGTNPWRAAQSAMRLFGWSVCRWGYADGPKSRQADLCLWKQKQTGELQKWICANHKDPRDRWLLTQRYSCPPFPSWLQQAPHGTDPPNPHLGTPSRTLPQGRKAPSGAHHKSWSFWGVSAFCFWLCYGHLSTSSSAGPRPNSSPLCSPPPPPRLLGPLQSVTALILQSCGL